MSIVYNTATTANGYLADAEDSLQWLFDVPGTAESIEEFQRGVGAVVMGSTTYRWILGQEDVLAHPELWAQYFGDRPVFVFTHRDLETPVGADVRRVSGPVAEALPGIRAAAGSGDVWVQGGGDLAGQFLDADALDAVTLTVAPVFLAEGRPLFPRTLLSDRLELVEVLPEGQFATLKYRIAPRDAAASDVAASGAAAPGAAPSGPAETGDVVR